MREENGKQRKTMEDKGTTSPLVFPLLPWFSLIFRVVVGGVLFYAGLSKAIAPAAEFAGAIAAYHLIPAAWATPLAIVLPWIEMGVGTYLFFGFGTRFFAAFAGMMFALFLGVLTSAILRGIDPGSCGCFGAGWSFSPRQTVFIDAGLLVACLLLRFLSSPSQILALDTWIEQ